MNSKPKNLLRAGIGAFCFFALAAVLSAETFIPPYDKIAPFRRDRLPINSKTISNLSNSLVSITSGSPYETAENRRAVAKAIALSLALDPGNKYAASELEKLVEGERPSFADKEKIDQERKQIANNLKWLSSQEAGADGNLLANLLGETVANMYPADTQFSSYYGKPESQAWNGWVASLDIFKKPPVVEEEKPEVTEPKDEEKEEVVKTEPKKDPVADVKKSVKKETAKVSTVFQMFNKDKSMWLPQIVTVDMRASNEPRTDEGEDYDGFRLQISTNSDDYWRVQEEITGPLRDQLDDKLNGLPDRAEINVRMAPEQSYTFWKNRAAISGPAYVLANSALTGGELDATVIAEIDRDGKLKVPPYFWRALMELTNGPGGRLIIPAAAEPHFINILALEKPDFFFKYEVLMASTVEELATLSCKNVSNQHEEIYGKFKIIKDKSAGNAMGAYLTNKYVRERLQEIVNQAPYHLSAKILNTYGSPARPRYLTREALASEIWRKIDVISEIVKVEDIYGINARQLEKLDEFYKQMRDDLKDLERYADTRNNDILEEGKDVVNSVRGFAREFEGKGEMWEKYDKIQAARSTMIQSNAALLEKFTTITGDPLPR